MKSLLFGISISLLSFYAILSSQRPQLRLNVASQTFLLLIALYFFNEDVVLYFGDLLNTLYRHLGFHFSLPAFGAYLLPLCNIVTYFTAAVLSISLTHKWHFKVSFLCGIGVLAAMSYVLWDSTQVIISYEERFDLKQVLQIGFGYVLPLFLYYFVLILGIVRAIYYVVDTSSCVDKKNQYFNLQLCFLAFYVNAVAISYGFIRGSLIYLIIAAFVQMRISYLYKFVFITSLFLLNWGLYFSMPFVKGVLVFQSPLLEVSMVLGCLFLFSLQFHKS